LGGLRKALPEPLPVEVERDLVFFKRILGEAIFLPEIQGATNVSLYRRGSHFDKYLPPPNCSA
jgi:hypothetical protein